jgi:hypothetical protein
MMAWPVMTASPYDRLSHKEMALSALFLLFVPMLSLWAVVDHEMSEIVRVFCFTAVMPWIVAGLFFLSRCALAWGAGEPTKGELDHLLARKRAMSLRMGKPKSDHFAHAIHAKRAAAQAALPPEFAHCIQAELPPAKTVTPPGDVLEQLVQWKRHNVPAIEREDE